MISGLVAKRSTYAGLFLITLTTLMHELLLTRIFSVTMWYHFAFVAISVAMFGMTVGALIVYLMPDRYAGDKISSKMAGNSVLFGFSMVFSLLMHLVIPFAPDTSLLGLCSVGLTYAVIGVPFVFSGIVVCLALTKFPSQVSRLYAVDLAGAAVGCVLFIYLLDAIDAPSATLFIALTATIGGLCFAIASGRPVLRSSIAASGVLALAAIPALHFSSQGKPFFRAIYATKGKSEAGITLYEKWNSFSRIRVFEQAGHQPFGWGMSRKLPRGYRVNQLGMNIDANAATILTEFGGDLNQLQHLRYDVTNIAHYIRQDAKIFVVGVGGGRDVLSALTFGQSSIVGVEINEDIIYAVNQRFGDFTGHLDQRPNVTFINDDARSYIARQDERYDIIQLSLIDTWAATAAGAFIFSENFLYTVEAWKLFLERLNPEGIVTVSRWYSPFRGEIHRLTALAAAALARIGVESPRGHIMLVKAKNVGTILLSPDPFSPEDVHRIEEVSGKMGFEVVLTPKHTAHKLLGKLAAGQDLERITSEYPLNISPPTDDSPFFFHVLRLRDLFRRELWDMGWRAFNLKAVSILGSLFLVMLILTTACIIGPLAMTTKRQSLRGGWPLLLFFGSIGMGFMLVEISQMQRLTVFLGHPTYGLSVVLFALLVSSGMGSFSTRTAGGEPRAASAKLRLGLLAIVVGAFGLVTPLAIRGLEVANMPVRIAASVGILFPLGFFMGMAFPLGMQLASSRASSLTPWLWGVNGATSVLASVLALILALSFGISFSFWVGCGFYVLALLAFLLASRSERKVMSRAGSQVS
jgi:spermidine synthase